MPTTSKAGEPDGWYYTQLDDNAHIWLRRLMCGTTSSSGTTGDPDFNQKIADRWTVLRTNILASSNLLARIDELAASLNEAQVRDFQKWPRLGTYVWPNPPMYRNPHHVRRHHRRPEELGRRPLQLDRLPIPETAPAQPRRQRRLPRFRPRRLRPGRIGLLHPRRHRPSSQGRRCRSQRPNLLGRHHHQRQ